MIPISINDIAMLILHSILRYIGRIFMYHNIPYKTYKPIL